MVLRSLIVAVSLAILACSSKNEETSELSTQLQEPMNTEEARNVFVLHCVSCHGIDGKLCKSNAADLSKGIITEAGIRRMILKGNNKGMMPYVDILNKREVEGLVKFVKTLRKKK